MPDLTFSFTNRRFIVTGASSGLGREIALALATAGGEVLAIARRPDRLDTLAAATAAGPGRVTPAALDVRDFAALATAVREFADSAPVHGLVHAAGGNAFTPLRQFDWRTADAILDTSLRAGLELCRLFAQKGIGSDGAAAVLVASAAAHCGQAGFAPYSAAKGALVAAARSLALELVPRRIRVNTVSPGWIPTELTRELARFYPTGEAGIAANHPLGLGTPADVAQATLFLLSDAARWITGTDLAIDGGYAAR